MPTDGELVETRFEQLHQSQRCMPDVSALAAEWDASTARELVTESIERADAHALEILVNVCGMNRVSLPVDQLLTALDILTRYSDCGPCFGLCGPEAVPPLIEKADSGHGDIDARAWVITVAAELALKHDLNTDRIRRIILKLEQTRHPMIQFAMGIALEMLDDPELIKPGISQIEIKTERLLPAERPRRVVGGDYTVRRAEPKLSRNAPCHCGSGKKYKKCCFGSDQEKSMDEPPYVDITQTERPHQPGLVGGDDGEIVEGMKPYLVARLDPADVANAQLIPAMRICESGGHLDKALDFLEEKERRGPESFDPGFYHDLAYTAVVECNTEFLNRIESVVPADRGARDPSFDIRVAILRKPERIAFLESFFEYVVSEDPKTPDTPADRISFLTETLAEVSPAFAIVMAWAGLARADEATMHVDFLVDSLRKARIALDLDPWDDPAETDYYDRLYEREPEPVEETDDHELDKLNAELADTRKAHLERSRQVMDLERQVTKLARKLEKAEEEDEARPKTETAKPDADPEEIRSMRTKINNMKAEIQSQQDERQRLRKELMRQRKRSSPIPAATEAPKEEPEDGVALDMPEGKERVIHPPVYSKTFTEQCAQAPAKLTARALTAATGFATFDDAVWRQAKAIEAVPTLHRIRIGIHHRLMLSWEPGQPAVIEALITRQEMDQWIRRKG